MMTSKNFKKIFSLLKGGYFKNYGELLHSEFFAYRL